MILPKKKKNACVANKNNYIHVSGFHAIHFFGKNTKNDIIQFTRECLRGGICNFGKVAQNPCDFRQLQVFLATRI